MAKQVVWYNLSMKESEKLNCDILNFFKEIENQSPSDRIISLRLLLDKYIHMTKCDFMMDRIDFNEIVSNAKKIMAEKTMPVKIGKSDSPIFETEMVSLCIIESTIMSLNKRGCLKKIPKFEYKE